MSKTVKDRSTRKWTSDGDCVVGDANGKVRKARAPRPSPKEKPRELTDEIEMWYEQHDFEQ